MTLKLWKNDIVILVLISILIGTTISLFKKLTVIEQQLSEISSKETTIEMIEVCDINNLEPKYNLYKIILALEIPYPDIVFKQAVLETGHFSSIYMLECNNLFGIMQDGQLKKYNHWIESVVDYKRFFSNEYKGGDYYQFLEDCTYSTNPNYIDLLKHINLEPYGL